ncbi:MAG: nicotinamide mononucleotide transporter [Crocinitomicaceae bacterium]|nr:nicotinamide mononucleotide transporter [Crocinitomicaceae bacterium]|tara:strand:+ start:3565 stop:4158 length:594 start_codon:yes stop_codon:yes gene_type:complete
MKFELIFFLEILAVLTGIVSVWFAKKENILVYPIGIISVLIWVYLCWFGNLFGQAVVNFFFFVINIYGWYNWSRKKEDDSSAVKIVYNTKNQNILAILISLVFWLILYFLLIPYKPALESAFYVSLEALITAMNFVAMFLLAWKRMENWIYWIVADIMCIPLFIHKDYYLGVIQFLFFIVIAFSGYLQWKKQIIERE